MRSYCVGLVRLREVLGGMEGSSEDWYVGIHLHVVTESQKYVYHCYLCRIDHNQGRWIMEVDCEGRMPRK